MTLNRHKTLASLLPPSALLALALALAGCGGGGTNGGGSSNTTTGSAPAPVLSASAALPDGLTATLAEDAATVAVGGGVTYTLTLTNNTSQPIIYEGTGVVASVLSVGGSLQIVNASGQTIFPQSGMGGNTGVAGTLPLTLAPGQSSSDTITASGVFTTAGRYAATATFTVGPASGTTATAVGPLAVTAQ